jgi:hypothetical protein
VVSVMDPYGRILGFLDRSGYLFFLTGPRSKPTTSQKIWNRTRTSGSVARKPDHQTTDAVTDNNNNNNAVLAPIQVEVLVSYTAAKK